MRTEREQQLVNAFTLASRNYLDSIGTLSLRAYGRYVGVARATAKKKPEIIEEIIAIFVGDLQPIERSKRGAPVKDDSFDPQIEAKMNAYRFAYLNEVSGSYNFEADNGGDSKMDWGLLLKTYKKMAIFAIFF
jgi:hypothetical protein